MKISFIIPCYCSSRTITSVVEEIKETVIDQDEYEIVLINDASKDNTFEIITQL